MFVSVNFPVVLIYIYNQLYQFSQFSPFRYNLVETKTICFYHFTDTTDFIQFSQFRYNLVKSRNECVRQFSCNSNLHIKLNLSI